MENCCDHCNNKEASHVCGSCQAISYCGVSCQKSHWDEHKAVCFNINNPDMKHVTSLIENHLLDDELGSEIYAELKKNPESSQDLNDAAVYLVRAYLPMINGKSADDAADYYDQQKAIPITKSKNKYKAVRKVKNTARGLVKRARDALNLYKSNRAAGTEKRAMRRQQRAQNPPAVPARDDNDYEQRLRDWENNKPIKNKLYF